MNEDYSLETSEPITTDAGTFRVRVLPDEDAINPREDCEPLGTMVLAHRRYNLPREGDLTGRIDEAMERGGLRLAMRYLSTVHGAVVLPVYGYDHGQLRLKAGGRTWPFDDQWDSGIAGLIYVLRSKVEAEWANDPMPTDGELAGWLAAEVDTYDTWSNGECTFYVVERKQCAHDLDDGCDCRWWEESNCGGYYSVEEAMQQGRGDVPTEAAEVPTLESCQHRNVQVAIGAGLCECGTLFFNGREYRPVEVSDAPNVRTWADGYGLWHARVIVPATVGERAASAAKAAIMRELRQRENNVSESRVQVRLVELTDGTAHYAEFDPGEGSEQA